MNHAPLMFPFDANCAVLFKDSVSATITVHEAMRVVYDVSGGCSIGIAAGAAGFGVVSSTIAYDFAALGVVSSTIVLNGFVGSCTLSFTAYFGNAPAIVSSTQSNAPAISRTLIAHSVILDPAFLLAAGPLTAGAPYPFKGEALLDGVFSSNIFDSVSPAFVLLCIYAHNHKYTHTHTHRKTQ